MTSIQQAYDDFLLYKNSYCEDCSVKYYRENIEKFFRFSGDFFKIDLNGSIEQLTNELYLNYISLLRSKVRKNTSINTYIRAVKVFSRFLFDEGYLDYDFSARSKFLKDDSDIINPLTASEVQAIDETFNLEDYIGVRNYCIFHLMLDCGFRTSEVINLKAEDIKFYDNAVFVVNSKNKKSRILPLPDFLQLQLNRLLFLIRMHGLNDYVFYDKDFNLRLSKNAVKQLYNKLKKRSGVKRIHAHLCRHTFATSFIYYGGNLEILRILMGHSDYNVTKSYLHVASQMLIIRYDIYKLDARYNNLFLKG